MELNTNPIYNSIFKFYSMSKTHEFSYSESIENIKSIFDKAVTDYNSGALVLKDLTENLGLLGFSALESLDVDTKSLVQELFEIYEQKNLLYGDSFVLGLENFGNVAALVRLSDKVNRAYQLIKNSKLNEDDEPIIDTLKDLINYSAMTYVYIDKIYK